MNGKSVIAVNNRYISGCQNATSMRDINGLKTNINLLNVYIYKLNNGQLLNIGRLLAVHDSSRKLKGTYTCCCEFSDNLSEMAAITIRTLSEGHELLRRNLPR